MCGIVGFYNSDSSNAFSLLETCTDTLTHRGPDAVGYYSKNGVHMGHRRLSIVDLNDRANQPFIYDQKIAVVFNGEIYNYQQLKNQLKSKGYTFYTQSDTEVLCAAYLEWGTDCFEKLDGMFAVAIYDIQNNQIILARDIFGKKPLYYSTRKDFSFCSELSAFKILNPEIKISLAAIHQFLSIGYTLNPTTIYEDIYLLPPSCYLVYDIFKRQQSITKYYSIEKNFFKKNHDTLYEIKENTIELLTKAIQKRLMGDVSGGIFLSSGLDSCGIAAISSKKLDHQLPSYTIAYPGTDYNENDTTETVAELLQLSHHHIDLSNIDMDDFHKYLKKQDYLTFDNSSYSIYKLSELASKSVRYVLTGDGGDEIFGGYSTYQADEINLKLRAIIPILKQSGFLHGIHLLTQNHNDKVGLLTKINRLTRGVDTDYRKAHYQWRLIFQPEQIVKIMGEQYRDLIYDTDPFRQFQKLYEDAKDLEIKDQHMYVDIKTWLTDNNLIKLDRNTMAHSLEARSPFLDRELFEYIAGCPVVYKNKKLILKETLKPLLPDHVINRKKAGFNSPVHQWFGIKENEFEYYTKLIYQKNTKNT